MVHESQYTTTVRDSGTMSHQMGSLEKYRTHKTYTASGRKDILEVEEGVQNVVHDLNKQFGDEIHHKEKGIIIIILQQVNR